ncbi:hypothetical protein A3K74_02470 [Candidatus Pacearchaeota archaeon RBG_13_33_26]|nr:MAG: hypothetical protein A3K74_02470 [Candidatus Pacearchaeota archaeon RBG_13_33_26]
MNIMAIRLAINEGYIYLAPSERKNIIDCIRLLENAHSKDGRLHSGAFQRALGLSRNTTAHALNLLMSARIIKPQQYGRMRLYSLLSGYKLRLKQKTRKIGRETDN